MTDSAFEELVSEIREVRSRLPLESANQFIEFLSLISCKILQRNLEICTSLNIDSTQLEKASDELDQARNSFAEARKLFYSSDKALEGYLAWLSPEKQEFPKTLFQPDLDQVDELGGTSSPRISDPRRGYADGPDNVANGVKLRARLIAEEIVRGHSYKKHVLEKGEFPGIRTRGEFAKVIRNIIENGESVTLSNNKHAYWMSGVVVIINPNGEDFSTSFPPEKGYSYFQNLRKEVHLPKKKKRGK